MSILLSIAAASFSIPTNKLCTRVSVSPHPHQKCGFSTFFIMAVLMGMSSLYILDIYLLSHIWFGNTVFHRLPFYSIYCFLSCREVFRFDRVSFAQFCFYFLLVFLMSYPRNPCQIQCQKASPFVSFQEYCGFRPYIQIFNLLRVTFCIWCKIRIQLCCFALGYPIFSTSFVGKTLPIVQPQHLCQRSVDCICEGLFSGSLLCWSLCLSLCQYHVFMTAVAL